MKIKFLLLAASMGLAANNAMAQFEGSDLNSRIEYSLKKAGVPEAELADSIMYTISYAKGFQDACAEQKYKDAYFNWKVLYRTKDYIMTPDAPYERMGDVPNVVFPCAALTDADTGRIAIYYGCADTVTGLAFTTVEELVQYTKTHSC